METKDEVVRKLEKKINNQKDMISENISYVIEALNEINSSMNIISYLSFLKDDLIKKDGV